MAFRTILNHDGTSLDQSVLLVFKAPSSYTGQDMVEFSLHGSPTILETLLKRLHEEGARAAEPGEFSFRAYWNGKITLDKAEGVAALISAEDEATRKGAARLLDGAVGESARQMQDAITDVAAKLELMLDFSEEETPVFPFEKLSDSLRETIRILEGSIQTAQQTFVASEGIHIALAGPTNAGKSSLLNKLLSREKAIVSHVPGTTRDVVEGEIKISGRKVKLFDTAGLRNSGNAIEREGVRRSRAVHRDADLVLWIHPGNKATISKEYLPDNAGQWLIINKTDLLDTETRTRWRKRLTQTTVQHFLLSAKTGDGVGKLQHAIADWIEKTYNNAASESVLPLNERHLDVYRKAVRKIKGAVKLLASNSAPEIIAQELKSAIDVLGEITGTGATEATLRKIFSGFCIGK